MTTTFHRHWRDVPTGTWRWSNFSPAEIACRGTGKLLINEPALDKLQALRDRLGKPLIVRSAYRSPEHNRVVGGATRSKHMDGAAFDIAMANHDPVAFEAAAREVGFLGFGFYPRSGFIHVDLGPARCSCISATMLEPRDESLAGFVQKSRDEPEILRYRNLKSVPQPLTSDTSEPRPEPPQREQPQDGRDRQRRLGQAAIFYCL